MYVQAKSKKAVNDSLKEGKNVVAMNIVFWNVQMIDWKDIPDGTPIKIYDKMAGDSPIAKAYGIKKRKQTDLINKFYWLEIAHFPCSTKLGMGIFYIINIY